MNSLFKTKYSDDRSKEKQLSFKITLKKFTNRKRELYRKITFYLVTLEIMVCKIYSP